MTTPKLLGIDVGTSSAKAVLIDAGGAVLASAAHDHPTYAPAPGWREQDSAEWWAGTVQSIRDVLAQSGIDPREIAAISLSGQGCACQPVSASGEALGRALIWTDERTGEQRARIRAILGDDLGPVAGNQIYDQPEPRMLWLRDAEPDRYNATYKFLTTVSYLILRLTGQFGANRSDWGFHLCFDRVTGNWNTRFARAVGLDTDKFPRLYDPWEVIGGVTAQAARDTGLAEGTPVVAGGQDATVSALAVGAFEPGASVYMRGTTDLLSILTDRASYHPDLYTTRSVLPGLYMSYDMKEVIAAGGGLKWLAEMLFNETSPGIFEEMNSLAAGSPPGAAGLLFLPYILMTTAPDPSLERGGSFFGLTNTTSRGDLCRAVMEGTAYALREAIERLRGAGIDPRDLRATGGPTRSPLWNQVTADVTHLPVLLPPDAAGAAYGAALLAGLGVGLYPLDDGYAVLRSVVSLGAHFDPRPEASHAYDQVYNVFIDLARSTVGYAPRLRRIELPGTPYRNHE